MANIPAVSIIIPTLNEEKYLPILLESLSKIDAPLEIIIVDGGSHDNTALEVEKAKTFFINDNTVLFIALSKKGIAFQRNVGVRHATNDLLLFCDADIVAPSTKEHAYIICDFIKNGYTVAASKMVPLEKTVLMRLAHTIAYGTQKLYALAGKPFFGGAYLLTTKKTFNDIGGFDESLRVSEDVDYALRAAQKGSFKLYKIPVGVSTRRFKKYGYAWIFENPKTLWKLLTKGKITNDDKIFYPFGEY